MDLEPFSKLIGFGVGGILAAFIFAMYRKDMKANAEAWRGQSDMLMTVVKENTAAITALVQLVHRIVK